jgi:K(+)-stimulated pyrophosphate-energized sodium pump
VIADCTGDNAGDSVGPSADGFETYGVTGVALITFILEAVHDPRVQVQLLVWIFVMRIMMIIASGRISSTRQWRRRATALSTR